MTFGPATPPPTPKNFCLTPIFETFAMAMAVLCGVGVGVVLQYFGVPWPLADAFISVSAVFGFMFAWVVVAR